MCLSLIFGRKRGASTESSKTWAVCLTRSLQYNRFLYGGVYVFVTVRDWCSKLNQHRWRILYCLLNVFFLNIYFFCNGELQVVSVSQAQKCTEGCNVATKRLTCLITYVFHFSNDKTSVSASDILLTAVRLCKIPGNCFPNQTGWWKVTAGERFMNRLHSLWCCLPCIWYDRQKPFFITDTYFRFL